MRGYIYITLKSDLCAASGDGFSLSIDTDICADRYGLPFIPSRRLKGCLREAAEYIGCERVDSIFGVSGNSNSGSLRIGDARFEDHETLRKQAVDSKYPAEKVLALFTSVKASTAIENDTAKENSLRFTRVVDHYSPFNKSETVFVSEIEYAEGDEEKLKNICLALRNIGYKRTRGYGSVRCEFKAAEDKKAPEINIPDDDNEYELWLTVKLRSPAMFPGKSSVETADYIPGSAVLGAFAGGYFKNGGDENDFDRLFLSGDVKFSNMYISDGNTVSEPAPAVLGKTKESNAIDYVFRDDDNKPLVKPFKGGYLIKGTEKKPEKEVIYHNGQKQGEDGKLLYTQEVLSEGQLFTGTVRGRGKDLRRLLPAIASGCINLGRSKTAQYSACDIVKADCVPVKPVKVDVPADREIFALLCSDVLLLGENAEFSTDISVLAKALNIASEAVDKAHSSLRYKTVMGYISVGRYKRPHIRAFEKGSVLCFKAETALPKYLTIGERQNEGFGSVKICTKEELMSLGRDLPETIKAKDTSTDCRLSILADKNKERENLRIVALDYADEQYNNVKDTFNAAFVGRLLLMVRQAEDKDDLDKRVASVKTDNKREKAQSFIEKAKDIYGNEWREFLIIALTVIKYKLKEAGKNE